jgi:hypothetical protein
LQLSGGNVEAWVLVIRGKGEVEVEVTSGAGKPIAERCSVQGL